MLEQSIKKEFTVIRMSLSRFDSSSFALKEEFVKAFCMQILYLAENHVVVPETVIESMTSILNGRAPANLQTLMLIIVRWCKCSSKPVVLILDEVDKAEAGNVFSEFLGMLRDAFIERNLEGIPAFQSVILAGVMDAERLKSGIGPDRDSQGSGSPWNIASDFEIPLELSPAGISKMLQEYATDHFIEVNIQAVTNCIIKWTSGYPWLVSRICQILDSKMVPDVFPSLSKAWTVNGVDEAANQIIMTSNSLFSSLLDKINRFPDIARNLNDFIFSGKNINYSMDNRQQRELILNGFVRPYNGYLFIHNLIFRVRLTRKFDDDFHTRNRTAQTIWDAGTLNKNKFIDANWELDVYHILTSFMEQYAQIAKMSPNLDEDEQERKFIEEAGRRQFLLYLAPIINGTGTYAIEEQTLNKRRMDVVIHYRGKRYIIQLKIWHGAKYNRDGEIQLKEYLDYYHLDVGYMLSFSFDESKKPEVTSHIIDGRLIHEVIV